MVCMLSVVSIALVVITRKAYGDRFATDYPNHATKPKYLSSASICLNQLERLDFRWVFFDSRNEGAFS
jgi:hypothetical protein